MWLHVQDSPHYQRSRPRCPGGSTRRRCLRLQRFDALVDDDLLAARVFLADRGYDSDHIRSTIAQRVGTPVVPARANRNEPIGIAPSVLDALGGHHLLPLEPRRAAGSRSLHACVPGYRTSRCNRTHPAWPRGMSDRSAAGCVRAFAGWRSSRPRPFDRLRAGLSWQLPHRLIDCSKWAFRNKAPSMLANSDPGPSDHCSVSRLPTPPRQPCMQDAFVV